ncbi:MAG: hypothetical protein WCG25_08675 [bacterium]
MKLSIATSGVVVVAVLSGVVVVAVLSGVVAAAVLSGVVVVLTSCFFGLSILNVFLASSIVSLCHDSNSREFVQLNFPFASNLKAIFVGQEVKISVLIL